MFLFNKRGCISMATFSKCVQAIYSMHEFLEDFNSLSIAGRPALLSSCVLTVFTGWCVVLLGQTRKCFEASCRCWGHKPITNPFPDTFKLCSPWQDLHCLWTQSLKYTQAALLEGWDKMMSTEHLEPCRCSGRAASPCFPHEQPQLCLCDF